MIDSWSLNRGFNVVELTSYICRKHRRLHLSQRNERRLPPRQNSGQHLQEPDGQPPHGFRTRYETSVKMFISGDIHDLHYSSFDQNGNFLSFWKIALSPKGWIGSWIDSFHYKVFQQHADLGWVDSDLGHSIILPGFSAISAKIPYALIETDRRRNCQNQSQQNQGSLGNGTPCTP